MSRPGKAPTSGSPEVLRARGTQGFGSIPEDWPGLGKLPTRLRCLPCAPMGWYFLITQVGRVVHQLQEGPGLCRIYGVACGTGPTIH